MQSKIVCVIPARLQSSRFPRKMLALLGKKPLVQWAYEAALSCKQFQSVVIATDSKEIVKVAEGFGATCLMTSVDCKSGTDRLVELMQSEKLIGDIWVNWQGDEPFISECVISELLQSIHREDQKIWTLQKALRSDEEIQSPNVVKVVTDGSGKALYFSRSPIPFGNAAFKHIGLYAYRSSALATIGTLSPCPLELAESLEQLRFLYHGLPIQVHETYQGVFGIDTKKQLAIAEEMCYTRG